MILLFLQLKDEIKDYTDLLFSTQSPIFIAGLILFILLIILHTFYQFIFKPLREKHYREQREAELKNAKILALFSERNPDPVLRINPDGTIAASNKAAQEILNLSEHWDTIFETLLDIDLIPHEDAIANNDTLTFTKPFANKVFDIHYNGISDLNFAQVYFYDITEREEFQQQVNEYQQKVTALVYKLENQLESERARISKDLHDSICQTLTIANMNIRKYENSDPAIIEKDELKHIEKLVSESVTEIRNVINDYKPIDLKNLGLEQSIKNLIQLKTKRLKIKGTCASYDMPKEIDEKIEICLFRVAQEATANIIKHSKATKFSIELSADENENEINMIISDDGIGFETTRLKNGKYVSSGNGVVNIQERVLFAGGELEIDTSPNNGTTLIISLPLIVLEDDTQI